MVIAFHPHPHLVLEKTKGDSHSFQQWIGQTLKDKFSITVKHIRSHQVDEIPMPDIEEKKILVSGMTNKMIIL